MLFQTERMNEILKSIYERLNVLEEYQIKSLKDNIDDLTQKVKCLENNVLCNLRMIQEVQEVTKEHQEFINDYIDESEETEEILKESEMPKDVFTYYDKLLRNVDNSKRTKEAFIKDYQGVVTMFFSYYLVKSDDVLIKYKEMRDKFIEKWGPK